MLQLSAVCRRPLASRLTRVSYLSALVFVCPLPSPRAIWIRDLPNRWFALAFIAILTIEGA
jgi:hypothetical protein